MLFDVPVNYLAVLVAGVSSIVTGTLWYGPLFGKPWMKLMGITPEKMAAMKSDPAQKAKMNRSYALALLGGLLTALVFGRVLGLAESHYGSMDLMLALKVGACLWLGLIVPVTLSSVLWESKPWSLWRINAFYYLANIAVMAVILGLWR